jgi:cytochrome c oxidase cbb3-type subunit III
VDDAWLWGGSDEAVLETLRVGINAAHPETRYSEMLAFGETGISAATRSGRVAAYVQSLSGLADAGAGGAGRGRRPLRRQLRELPWRGRDRHARGGRPEPDRQRLDLRLGRRDAVRRHLQRAQGWMPHWDGRMTEAEIKMIAIYMLDILPERQQ